MAMSWLNRLRMRWQMRGSVAAPIGTTALPTEQRETLSEEEKWKREHGFSAATSPMEATAEIAAHNKAVEEEYQAEVDHRKALFEAGEYTPRFMVVRPGHHAPEALIGDSKGLIAWMQANPGAVDVNWDLELTMSPGRRHDVTEGIGKPVLPMPTEEDMSQVRAISEARAKVEAHEALDVAQKLGALTPDAILKKLGLTDAQIREAAQDNDLLYRQLKAKATEMAEELAGVSEGRL